MSLCNLQVQQHIFSETASYPKIFKSLTPDKPVPVAVRSKPWVARLLGLRVLIPPEAQMSVSYERLCGVR